MKSFDKNLSPALEQKDKNRSLKSFAQKVKVQDSKYFVKINQLLQGSQSITEKMRLEIKAEKEISWRTKKALKIAQRQTVKRIRRNYRPKLHRELKKIDQGNGIILK